MMALNHCIVELGISSRGVRRANYSRHGAIISRFASRSAIPQFTVFCIALLCLLGFSTGRAAQSEGAVLTNALEQFQGGFYGRSESAFSNFVVQFPQSSQVARARLFQARSAMETGRLQVAGEILATNVAQAGALADQFQYWLGRVQLLAGKPEAAATTFANLGKAFTNSPLRVEAAVGQAEAHFSLGQWSRVADVIEDPNGVFQAAARARDTNDAHVARGYLMVAQAWWKQRQYDRVKQAALRVSGTAADARLRWERQFLLCRAELALQQTESALARTTNLLSMSAGDPQFRAASTALQGDVFIALGRPADAIRAFEANLADGVPVERRREAFLRTIQLYLQQDNLTNAIARLERFVNEQPADAATDVAWLALGELRLKQYQLATFNPQLPTRLAPALTNSAASGTNLLEQALETFNRLITNFPGSSYLGKAHLDRGWILLEQGRLAESIGAFQTATNLLDVCDDQAVAAFKLGDLEFRTGDMTNAIRNYRRVIHQYSGFARVQRDLRDRAMYQLLQAGIAAGDMAAAREAVQQITADYPESRYADRSVLLFGQALNDLSVPAAARKVFASFAHSFPASPLLPDVKLAIARTFERELNWRSAAAEYADWVRQYPANSNLAQAEFYRAAATWHAGDDTNAFHLFTNFVARFVTNDLAARAQFWIGDYYFLRARLNESNTGDQDYREAERNYQLLFTRSIGTNWPVSDLTYQAQVRAGHAAYKRQAWDDAASYFTTLINLYDKQPRCPVSAAVEATFAYGDLFIERPGTNSFARYIAARDIFATIPTLRGIDPNDPQIPRAYGRIANCYFQLAALRDTNDVQAIAQDYAQAYEFYRKVTNSPVADINLIAQALVGMGDVRQRQARSASGEEAGLLLKQAVDHYLDIVYAPADERPDPTWYREATSSAGRLCEEQKRYRQAIEIYARTAEMVPVLRAQMDRRIAAAREKESLQSR